MVQAYDTLETARALEAGGFKREQAEVLASAIRHGQGELVTKADLETALAQLESRLIKQFQDRQMVMLGIAVAVIIGAIKFL